MILYNNNYYANYTNTTSNTSIFAGIGLVYLILSLTVTLLMIISMWKIFKKAGRNGWEAIIPIYNIYVLFEIGGQKGAYIFCLLIPCIGQIIFLVFEIKALIELSRRFGKDTGFAILCLFFPIIGFPLLAFSKATYQDAITEPTSSILDVNTTGVQENQDFNYGYENQDTTVMNKVTPVQDTVSVETPVVPTEPNVENTTPVEEAHAETPVVPTEPNVENITPVEEAPAETPVVPTEPNVENTTPVEETPVEAPVVPTEPKAENITPVEEAPVEAPVVPTEPNVENITPVEETPVTPTEPVTSVANGEPTSTIEQPVNQVDRFHTPSALDNNNQN